MAKEISLTDDVADLLEKHAKELGIDSSTCANEILRKALVKPKIKNEAGVCNNSGIPDNGVQQQLNDYVAPKPDNERRSVYL